MTAVKSVRWSSLLPLLTHVLGPLALFYGLRALGVAAGPALLAGSAVSAGEVIVTAALRRRMDTVALTVLGIMAASAASSLITGDPRFLLLRNAVGTAVLGVWLLVTVVGRPLLFEGAAMFQSASARVDWERRWRESPRFRQGFRVLTVVWGLGFLADAALRAVLAMTAPVDLVPVVDDVLLVVTVLVLLVVQKVIGRHYRLRHGVQMRSSEHDGEPARDHSSGMAPP